jgi:dephospho-CoA kinase
MGEGKKQIWVGITGSLGAGKSTVSRVFAGAGYPVFSADVIAREVVAPGAPALAEIAAAFGAKALLPDGSLDRVWMREAIAQDPQLRQKLEAITHPRIKARSRELAEAEFAKGAKIVFYEAPLLFEAASERVLGAVVCVAASEENRIARVVKRDGSSPTQAKALIDAQMPQDEKIRRSQYVIWNDGSEEAVREEANKVLASLLAGLA